MKKEMSTANTIEFTKESGEVIAVEKFSTELAAQEHFDELSTIRYPKTYKALTMNLSEYPENRIGSVRLVVTSPTGNRYVRRELYRKA